MSRDKIEVEATTEPDLNVMRGHPSPHGEYDRTTRTDGKGRHTLVIDVPATGPRNQIPRDLLEGRIEVSTFELGLLGKSGVLDIGKDEILNSAVLELGFPVESLRNAPAAPQDPWVYFLGSRKGDLYPSRSCIAVSSVRGSQGAWGGGRFTLKEGAVMGTPGAKVTLLNKTLLIEDNGIARWTPPEPETMLSAFHADLTQAIATSFSLELEGKAPVSGEVKLTLGEACQERVSQGLRAAVESKRPLGTEAKPEGAFAVMARANGELLTAGELAQQSRGNTRASVPHPLANAKYVAIETETGRRPGKACTQTFDSGKRTSIKGRLYKEVTKSKVQRPEHIDTKIQLYRLPGYELVGSRGFEGKGYCDRKIYPSTSAVKIWITETIKADPGGK